MEWLARGAQVLIALGGAYLVAFWFVLAIWTFRDIETRSRNVVAQIFATLMVVLFFVPGVLLYLILRPKETLDEAFQRSLEEEYLLQDLEELPLCPSCHQYVNDDFILCPQCHVQLREPCTGCSRLVDLRWALCAYCGMVQHGRTESAEPVAVPEARWTDPRRRRARAGRSPATPARPDAEPALIARANDSVVEPVATPAGLNQPFSMVAGMKSIVRPFDRFRLRDPESGEVIADHDREANAPGANVSSIASNGSSRRMANGDGPSVYQLERSEPNHGPITDQSSGSQSNGRGHRLRDSSPSQTPQGSAADQVNPNHADSEWPTEDGEPRTSLASTGADRGKRLP